MGIGRVGKGETDILDKGEAVTEVERCSTRRGSKLVRREKL